MKQHFLTDPVHELRKRELERVEREMNGSLGACDGFSSFFSGNR